VAPPKWAFGWLCVRRSSCCSFIGLTRTIFRSEPHPTVLQFLRQRGGHGPCGDPARKVQPARLCGLRRCSCGADDAVGLRRDGDLRVPAQLHPVLAHRGRQEDAPQHPLDHVVGDELPRALLAGLHKGGRGIVVVVRGQKQAHGAGMPRR
jgi:hypothetical protein